MCFCACNVRTQDEPYVQVVDREVCVFFSHSLHSGRTFVSLTLLSFGYEQCKFFVVFLELTMTTSDTRPIRKRKCRATDISVCFLYVFTIDSVVMHLLMFFFYFKYCWCVVHPCGTRMCVFIVPFGTACARNNRKLSVPLF